MVEPENDETTLFGKTVSDLQSNIVIGTSEITGTLNYISDYSGFSMDTTLQKGNFIALSVESSEGATTTVEVVNGTCDPVTLDSNMNVVLRITNKNTQSIRVITTVNGESVTKTYALTGLVCSLPEVTYALTATLSDDEVYGETVSDFQSNIVIDNANKIITGTVNYVDDFQGWREYMTSINSAPNNPASGFYLILDLTTDPENASKNLGVCKSEGSDWITDINANGTFVIHLQRDFDTHVKVWTLANGYAIPEEEDRYDITGLTYGPAPDTYNNNN